MQVRFKNSGGKQYARAEVHIAYRLPKQDATKVTFTWSDAKGEQKAEHTFTGAKGSGPCRRRARA